MREREHRPEQERDPEGVRAFAGTFLSRTDIYPLQRHDGRYVTVRKLLTLAQVASHLQGALTLGAYALDAEDRAKWICLDADDDHVWQRLVTLSQALYSRDIPSYLEQSRRGGHLWLFFEQPLPGGDARQFGRYLLVQHDVENVELFPKQDRLSTGPGSLVRLPLGIHRKTGIRYHFINPDGSPLAPTIREQLALLADPVRVPVEVVSQVLANDTTLQLPDRRAGQSPTGQGTGETLSARLKDRIAVYDFVRQYVQLDERGRGLCPFHPDHHASFSVNRDANYWHCFAGCGGGSIVDFWMKWRETHGQDPDFTATLHDLANMLF